MSCDYCKETNKQQCVEVCPSPKFTTDVRKQFELEADADTICSILQTMGEEGINLFARVTYVSSSTGKTGLIFIPGQDDYQSKCSVKCAKSILKKFCVEFVLTEVVVVTLGTRVPGTFAQLFCALNQCMTVETAYSATNGDAVFQVSSVEKAVKVISKLK